MRPSFFWYDNNSDHEGPFRMTQPRQPIYPVVTRGVMKLKHTNLFEINLDISCIFLGNHESITMNQMYGFDGEVKAKYPLQNTANKL